MISPLPPSAASAASGVLAPATAVPVLGNAVSARIRQLYRGSLHIRHVDAGSCNACDWEMTALLNPVYDVQRLGIDFVASPRHADMLMVTGPLTAHLKDALLLTYAAAPSPCMVMALGACAISGGLFAGAYASHTGIDDCVPVDVYVPGCPPRPQAILYGLWLALGKAEQRMQAGTVR